METIISFKELEYKYKADNIDLLSFKELMLKLSPVSSLEISSYDIYYTNIKDEFIRFRKNNNKSELTIKRKLNSINSQNRKEINIPIHTDNEVLVEAFVDLLGYKKNFKIFKCHWIFWFDSVNTVWYSIFDENMKEVGRYLEIEANEKFVHSQGEEKAFEELKAWELKLAPLGLLPQNRLRKSLFDMYFKMTKKGE